MTKKVIAIISVLKPVDDSRNFEKIATTVGNTNKYDINIIGFLSKKIPTAPNTNFYPIFNFSRLSVKRIFAPLKTFNLLIKLKPEVIIVTCAELLIITVFYKIIFGSKIVYDIQENYYRNIVYSGAYPGLMKYPLAWMIRAFEIITASFIDRFILAEKIYGKQLKFASVRSVVLENKAVIPLNLALGASSKDKEISMLYSGTISAHYGVFEAIALVKRLSKVVGNITLKIFGFASQSSIRDQLMEITKNSDLINILSIDKLVPHDQILTEMNNADFCILPYQKNKSTEGRIPTKLFECLAMEKPVIIQYNDAWNSLIEENNAGIIYDFTGPREFPIDNLHQEYYGRKRAFMYTWDNNRLLLINVIDELMDQFS
jgi:glycosyltransferase involved in cell wall biosynthesis